MLGRALWSLAVAVAISQALAQPVAASDTCTQAPNVVTVLGREIYIDDRRSKGDGLWIYAENDDKPGLQRGGNWLGFEDPCHRPNTDTPLVFVP